MKKSNLNLKRYKRVCTFIMADTHAGYQFGLCPPKIKLPKLDDYLLKVLSDLPSPQEQLDGLTDGWYEYEFWTPELTSTQVQLNAWYEQDYKAVLDWIDGDPFTSCIWGTLAKATPCPVNT
jgi:hypothetical protein